MAQSFLIFDFGSNEEAAMQAKHTVDRWKQGFRLDKKMLVKFDRKESDQPDEVAKTRLSTGDVLVMVKLDFSDHEKLSYTRWIERIPSEAPFKDAKPKVIHANDTDFGRAAERFGTLA